MPNLEVKRCNADGSVGVSHVRVGHRQVLIWRDTIWETGWCFLFWGEGDFVFSFLLSTYFLLVISRLTSSSAWINRHYHYNHYINAVGLFILLLFLFFFLVFSFWFYIVCFFRVFYFYSFSAFLLLFCFFMVFRVLFFFVFFSV